MTTKLSSISTKLPKICVHVIHDLMIWEMFMILGFMIFR